MGELYVDGGPVLTSGRLLATLRTLPPLLEEIGVILLTEQARRKLQRAA